MEELLEWTLICDPSVRFKFAEIAEKAKMKNEEIQEAIKKESSVMPPGTDQGQGESSNQMETNQ